MSVINWTKIFHQLWKVHLSGQVIGLALFLALCFRLYIYISTCIPASVGKLDSHEKTNPGHNKKEKKWRRRRSYLISLRNLVNVFHYWLDRLMDNRGEESEEEGQDMTWVIALEDMYLGNPPKNPTTKTTTQLFHFDGKFLPCCFLHIWSGIFCLCFQLLKKTYKSHL